jgi:PEP-CTERM motif
MRLSAISVRTCVLSIAVLISTVILAGPAYGDAVNPNYLTLVPTTSSLVLTEGNAGVTDTFTLTNPSSYSVSFSSPPYLIPGTTTGDATDIISSYDFTTNPGTCGTSLDGGSSSCTFILTVNTPSPADDTDLDSGTTPYTVRLLYYTPGIGVNYYVDAPLSITVNDPTPVPEPSSLLLFGAGLLVLAVLAVRGKRSALTAAS